jgi:hypothetical protein
MSNEHKVNDTIHPVETLDCTLLKWTYRDLKESNPTSSLLEEIGKRINSNCTYHDFNKRYGYDPNTEKYEIKAEDSGACQEWKQMSNIGGKLFTNYIIREC